MSERDELIAKARQLDGSATNGPWRHDNVQHQNCVISIERIITPWGLQFYDAQFIAESRTLLPALADLAESEGRRADTNARHCADMTAARNRMDEARALACLERDAALAELAALKGQQP